MQCEDSPRKKGDLHVVKDNDLLFFGTTKKHLAEVTHCLFSFCVNFFPVTTVSSAPSRNFFKRDSDEISILRIKRANTLVNITYIYLRYIIISSTCTTVPISKYMKKKLLQ